VSYCFLQNTFKSPRRLCEANAILQMCTFVLVKLMIFSSILELGPLVIRASHAQAHGSKDLLQGLKKGIVPEASTRGILPRKGYVKCPGRCTSLYNIATMLSQALNSAGYSQQAWYLVEERRRVPTIAVITQIEQIHDDGRPRASMKRWDTSYSSADVSSLDTFLKVLISGSPPGRYRSFVFGISLSSLPVTNIGPEFAIGRENDRFSGVRDALRGGNRIPFRSALSTISANDYEIYVFVYEYQVSSVDGSTKLIKNSSLPAIDHLRKSGILKALGAN
jgi:hypothetical protein